MDMETVGLAFVRVGSCGRRRVSREMVREVAVIVGRCLGLQTPGGKKGFVAQPVTPSF